MTPEQRAEWHEAYGDELAAAAPEDSEGVILDRAAERTAHLWGVRISPVDGSVIFNPEAMSEEGRAWYQARHPEPDCEPEAGQ
jgi:hypothetical protein